MIQIATYSDIGGRLRNEDTVRCVQRGRDRLCLIVADGLGGHGGGERASSEAADTICGLWRGGADRAELTELIQAADRRVRSLQTPMCAMKTTAVVLALEPGRAVWAHAGDSRLYHFQDGTLDFQTRDHSAAQIGVMLGQIERDQIRHHPDRNRVLRALGQDTELMVETAQRDLSPGRHAFLLCSDGFWEYVLEDEMAADLRAAADPEDWLARMRQRLAERVPADNDNNTAAAVWVDGQA